MILQVTLAHTAPIVVQVATAEMLIRLLQNQILVHVKHVAEKGTLCAMDRKKLVSVAELGRLYHSLTINRNDNGAIKL